jgi:hypothetical protein
VVSVTDIGANAGLVGGESVRSAAANEQVEAVVARLEQTSEEIGAVLWFLVATIGDQVSSLGEAEIGVEIDQLGDWLDVTINRLGGSTA